MKVMKLLSFVKFCCASNGIFLKFLCSKLNFLQAKLQTSIWTKKVIQRWYFPISWIGCILNYPIYDNSNMSTTNPTNRLLVVWVRVNRGQIYLSLQFNAAWNPRGVLPEKYPTMITHWIEMTPFCISGPNCSRPLSHTIDFAPTTLFAQTKYLGH